MTELYRVKEVTVHLGVSKRTVEREIAAGKITVTWVRGIRFVTGAEVRRYLASRERRKKAAA